MPTTVALCRWYGGWREVEDATGVATFGRRSALLSLGALHSIQEVDRVAGEELSSTFAKTREQQTVEHRPATVAERPYVGYRPGDWVTADDYGGTPTEFQALNLAIREDDDGQIQVVPALGDIITGIDELQGELRANPNLPRRRVDPIPDRERPFSR